MTHIELLVKQINSNEAHEEADSDIEDGNEDEEVIFQIKLSKGFGDALLLAEYSINIGLNSEGLSGT